MAGKLDLPPRLRLLADWVPPGARLADVGTDHGYLPAYLLLQGRIVSAVASDLRPGPLDRARSTGRLYGVEDRIAYRLCDGLEGIGSEECDTVAVAGMGGENIARILSRTPWLTGGRHTLLLQPQSRAEELRWYLLTHGFCVTREALAEEGDALYIALEAKWTGERSWNVLQAMGGVWLQNDPLGDRYLVRSIVREEIALGGALRGLMEKRARLPAGDGVLQRAEQDAEVHRLRIGLLLAKREEWRNANSV